MLFILIIFIILGFFVLLVGAGSSIDSKCPPYDGITKKEEKEYIKQYIKEHPEYTENDFY